MNLHVVFRVSSAEYVLPAHAVVQMESFTGATKVPGTVAYVAGIVQIRGLVVPVVDLRARFHLPAQEPTLDSRIVVVKVGDRPVGLLVDSAREVVKLEDTQFRPPPEVVGEQAQGFVKSVAQFGTRLLLLIDYEKVIGQEQIHGH